MNILKELFIYFLHGYVVRTTEYVWSKLIYRSDR